jgi:hypothetical protein
MLRCNVITIASVLLSVDWPTLRLEEKNGPKLTILNCIISRMKIECRHFRMQSVNGNI